MSPKLKVTLTPKTSTRVSLRRVLIRTAIIGGATGILVSAAVFLYNNFGTSEDAYACHDPFPGGNYRIGGSGNTPSPGCSYVDLTAFAAAMNGRELCGPVTAIITSTYNSAEENSFPVTFSGITGSSAVNTITIRPDAGVNPVISGSGASILKLTGVKYFTIDGSGNAEGSRDLTIKNNSTATNTSVIWLSSTGTNLGPENVSIKNCIISHNANTSWSAHTFGIILAGTSQANNYSDAYVCKDARGITIENCYIKKSLWGIWASGKSSNRIDNLRILNNTLGGEVQADYIGFCGIDLNEATNSLIKGNTIQNVQSSIGNSAMERPVGMWFGNLLNTNIYNNIIRDIVYTGNQPYGGKGMEFYGMANNYNCNITVANNLIYNIGGRGGQIDKGILGIRVVPNNKTMSNIKFYFNTITLSGTMQGNNGRSACMYFNSGGTLNNIDVRNNAFSNSITSNSQNPKSYAFACDHNPQIFSELNFNNYFVTGNAGVMGFVQGMQKFTLDEWRSYTETDYRSLSGDPGFMSATDFHPNPDNPNSWVLSGKATQINGLNFDLEYKVRSVNPADGIPDIGAYEFDINPGIIPATTTEITPPAPGVTSEYQFEQEPVTFIKWYGSSLPAINIKYYTNRVPSDIPSGNNSYAYWEITPTGGSNYSYDLVLTYDESMLGSIISENDLIIAKSNNNGTWENLENTIVDVDNNTVTVTAQKSFSRFILTDRKNPLPISLVSFDAKLLDTRVWLTWATATETNNDFFTIERSSDARDFTPIATVKGAGNSNTMIRYQEYDDHPLEGVNYYRLKQTDFDGKFSYSKIVSVNTGGSAAATTVEISSFGPNPFSSSFALNFTSEQDQVLTVNIFNSGGQLVFTEPYNAQPGENTYTFNDFMDLPRGIYLVNIVQGSRKSKYIKMIKE